MMSKYCSSLSSIPRSFASISLFTTLFALCFFSILYINTQQNNYINGINELLKSKTSPIRTSLDKPTPETKIVGDSNTKVETIDDHYNGGFDSSSIGDEDDEGSNNEVNSKDDQADYVDKVDNSSMAPPPQAPPPPPPPSPPPPPPPSPPPEQVTADGFYEKLSNFANPSWIQPVDEAVEDDDDSLPNETETLWAPQDVPVEVRMSWFMRMLPKIRVLNSTPKTQRFDERVRLFFGLDEQFNSTRCSSRFYMTWISPANKFGKREIFALESIFKSHPKSCILIVSSALDSKLGRRILEPLVLRGFQVFAAAPDLRLLAQDTPAQPWVDKLMNGQVDPGRVRITQNLSNLIRLLVVYKYGGIYLDVDFIILKDISEVKNSIGVQTTDEKTGKWTSLNNAVLIFERHHPLMYKFIDDFTANFNGSIWGQNGPLMVNRVVRSVLFNEGYRFNILSRIAFYPVDWYGIFDFFEEPKNASRRQWVEDNFKLYEKHSYGIHLWNTATRPLKIPPGSLVGKLITNHCVICEDIYDYDGPKSSN